MVGISRVYDAGVAPLMASSSDELHLKFKFPRLEIVHNLLTILFRVNFIKKLYHTLIIRLRNKLKTNSIPFIKLQL